MNRRGFLGRLLASIVAAPAVAKAVLPEPKTIGIGGVWPSAPSLLPQPAIGTHPEWCGPYSCIIDAEGSHWSIEGRSHTLLRDGVPFNGGWASSLWYERDTGLVVHEGYATRLIYRPTDHVPFWEAVDEYPVPHYGPRGAHSITREGIEVDLRSFSHRGVP